MTDFYKRLQKYAESHGMNMKELAELVGVNPQTLGMWQYSIPKSVTLLNVSKTLKLSPFYLINGDETVTVKFPK